MDIFVRSSTVFAGYIILVQLRTLLQLYMYLFLALFTLCPNLTHFERSGGGGAKCEAGQAGGHRRGVE